jgi:hypothetical protein
MTRTTTRLPLAALLLAAAIGLAACGGGGGDNGSYFPVATAPPPPAEQPVMPADPYDTFVAFVKGLIGSLLDTAEPVDVAAFDPPPTSETKEPIPTE